MSTGKAIHRLELLLRPVSILTLAALPLCTLGEHCRLIVLPGWLQNWVLPVLTAAAIGYLTNYVAIEMLFKPYRRGDRHWLHYATLGWWRQGLVPANQAEIARVLGQEIPERLLDPERLSEDLSALGGELLSDPENIEFFRERMCRYLRLHGKRVARSLAPVLTPLLHRAVRSGFASGSLGRFWDEVGVHWLTEERNRDFIVEKLLPSLQECAPELTAMLREGVRCYIRDRMAALPGFLQSETVVSGMTAALNWQEISRMIREKIGAPETRRMLSGKIPEFADRIGSFLHSEYADKELAELFGPASGKLETLLAAELERKLPEIAGALLDSPDFKRFLHGQLVPASGKMLERCMQRQGRGKIIACLDLSGRIEAAVKAQDVREFHAMINVVAAEHLGAIQVLGYFLGGLAGILLALVSFRG